jgi:DNA replication protein DnaC
MTFDPRLGPIPPAPPVCGQCGEPAVTTYPPRCQVHLDSERERDQAERDAAWLVRAEELRRIHAEQEIAGLTPPGNIYAGATIADPRLLAWVDELVAGTAPKRSILVWGKVGIGKTYSMYGLGHELIRRGFHIGISSARSYRRESVVRLLAGLRPGGGVETLDEAITVPVLLLDDLGSEKATDWTLERLYELVNERYEANAVTIISTNAKPEDMPAAVGPRVASRLYEMCLSVPLSGTDRRLQRKASS